MQKKLLLLVLLATVGSWLLCGVMTPAVAAKDSMEPEIKMIIGRAMMKKYALEPRDIVALRLSGDGSRLFLVEHGYHLPSRMLIFDTNKGKLIGEARIKVREISSFAPNRNGTKVFIVANFGQLALELNVTTGKYRPIFKKMHKKGFRFMIPIGVNCGLDGKYLTRGYYLDSEGKTAGDYVVSFDTSGSGPAKIKRLVNITKLLKSAGGKGRVTALSINEKRDKVVFVVTTSLNHATLYFANLKKSTSIKKLDEGMSIGDTCLDASGDLVYYVIDYKSVSRLMNVNTSTGKKYMIANGSYIVPMASRDNDTVLVSEFKMSPISQKFFFVKPRKGWKLHQIKFKGFVKGDRLAIYNLAEDGRTFFLWSKDKIVVGTLP